MMRAVSAVLLTLVVFFSQDCGSVSTRFFGKDEINDLNGIETFLRGLFDKPEGTPTSNGQPSGKPGPNGNPPSGNGPNTNGTPGSNGNPPSGNGPNPNGMPEPNGNPASGNETAPSERQEREPDDILGEDFVNQLKMMAKITKTKFGDMGMADMESGPMKGALEAMIKLSMTPPWVAQFTMDMKSTPDFYFPPYVLELNGSRTITNKIDFPTVVPVLRTVLQETLNQGVPPTRLVRAVAPRLYALKAGCPVNVVQRMLSMSVKNWADDGIKVIQTKLSQFTDEDVLPLLQAIKREVLSEVNTAIFGEEFKEFDELVRFIQMSVLWNLKFNNSTNPPSNSGANPVQTVLGLTQYLLQCKDRQSFIQELISRISTLKRRILFVNPWAFTARILKKLPFQCVEPENRPGPKMLNDIYNGVAFSLNIIQKSLGRIIGCVQQTMLRGEGQCLEKLLPEAKFTLLVEALLKLRTANVPPFVPPPAPIPTPGNYTDVDLNPLPPMDNETYMDNLPPYPGNGSFSHNPTPTSGNGNLPTNSPVSATTTSQPVSANNTEERRSQNNSKTELLKLLLRNLAALKRGVIHN